jgi:hypothetical protein
MPNPNNCSACDHKRHPDGGWCYMFRSEPAAVCAQHTARQASFMDQFEMARREVAELKRLSPHSAQWAELRWPSLKD